MPKIEKKDISPRVRVVQKIYGSMMNPDEEISYPKSQFKKFIKDVTEGTLERREFIEETLVKYLENDLNLKKTDKILKIIIFAAVFELLYKHNTHIKVIISEYIKTSEFFLEQSQIKYVNAMLDKLSKQLRKH